MISKFTRAKLLIERSFAFLLLCYCPFIVQGQACAPGVAEPHYVFDSASVFFIEPRDLDLGGQIWVFDTSKGRTSVLFGAAHDGNKRLIKLGEYSNGKGLRMHSFKYPKGLNLDARSAIVGLATYGNVICVNLGGYLLKFDWSGSFLGHIEIDRWWGEIFYINEDRILLTNCYDHASGWAPSDWSMKVVNARGESIAERAGSEGEMFLTNFGPTSLFDVSKNRILRSSPGRTALFLYNQDLELVDSLVLSNSVLHGDEWLIQRLSDTLRKPVDGVSLAMDAMDDEVLKVHKVCFVNDSMVMLTYASGKNVQFESLVEARQSFGEERSVKCYDRADRMQMAEANPDSPMEGSWFGYHNVSAYSAILGNCFYQMYPWTERVPVGMTYNEFMDFRMNHKPTNKLAIQVWRYQFVPDK